MATYYFRNTGDVNWGTSSNWSLTDGGGATGAIPTSTDDAYFTINSGDCTVNTSNRVCLTLNFTGYINSITMTNNITVSGNITLSSTMSILGTGGLIVNSTASLTSNGKTWSNFLTLGTASTITLIDDWTIQGDFNYGNATLNGNTLNLSGDLVMTASTGGGTTLIKIMGSGTQTWSGNNLIKNNITIDCTGDFIISGSVQYNTGTFTYLQGTVTAGESTLSVQSSTTFNTDGMIWGTINCFTVSTNVFTLTSDFTCQNFLYSNNSTSFNGNNLRINGNLSGNGIILASTSPIIMQGKGIISAIGSNGISLRAPLIIDTKGTIFLNSTINLTGIFIHRNGRLITPPSINNITNINFIGNVPTAALNLNKISLSKIQISTNTGIIYLNEPPQGTASKPCSFSFGNINFGEIIETRGSSTGTVFTVTNINQSILKVGTILVFPNIASIATISSLGTGRGGIGTYNINTSTNITNTVIIAINIINNEKISRYVKMNGCTFVRRNQLLIANNISNKGTNVGVRYINSLPNKSPMNNPNFSPELGFGLSLPLSADPNFILR